MMLWMHLFLLPQPLGIRVVVNAMQRHERKSRCSRTELDL